MFCIQNANDILTNTMHTKQNNVIKKTNNLHEPKKKNDFEKANSE